MNGSQRVVEGSGAANVRTLEIRWFFAEDQPGLKSPFDGFTPEQFALESRTDRYLLVPGREDLGIKVRQGRLEVKYRIGRPEGFKAAPGIRGRVECWEKLGFELAPGGVPGALPENFGASWVELHKQRWAASVRLEDGRLNYTPPWKRSPDSVLVEYTKISLEGGARYTFGLEWPDGGSSDLAQALLKEWVLPHGLRQRDSMGYPAFLLHRSGPS
jgi:hypothetical protein